MKQRMAPEDFAAVFNSPTWACAGKDVFTDRATADRVVADMRRRRLRRNGALKVYRCQFCRQWHIGSNA